jgi:aryl carrier-like protein
MGASFTAQQLAELRKSSGQDGTQRLLTKAEQTMQQLWARVLEVEAESIGPEDNFFQLGGDSITAMKLVGEARKAGLQLTLAEIFRHAQLGTFANRCVQAVNESVDKITAPFSLLSPATKDAMFSATRPFYLVGDMNSIVDVLPVTYTQKYFIKKGIQNPREAFNYFSIGLEAALDTQRLKDSCRALLEHFPILRTHFCEWKRELYQVIPRQYNVPLKVFDVDGVLVDESHAIRMRDIDHIRPLGLPTSLILVRHTSGASRLIVRLSHAQYDGVSLPVMLKSFASLYQQESLRPNLDFSRYLAYMQERHTASAHYWRQLLNGSQITRIASKLVPKMRNDTTIETIRLEKVISAPKLPTGLTTGLLVSCAWAIVLSHISGNVDVVYGLVVTGRNSNLPGITEMLAPCVNFVPVRAQMSSTNSSAQLLHSLQDQFISLGESDSMGLGDIVQHCTDWPAGSEFESIVQHQNIDEQPQFQFSGENTKLEWFENPFAVPNRFSILSHPRGDGLAITIGGNTGMMTGESAQILMNMICDTISRLSGDLGTPIGSCKSSLPECTWG